MVPLQLVAFLIVSAIIPAVLAAIAFQRRNAPAGRAFLSLMLAVTFWSVTYIGEVIAPTLEEKLFWVNLEYLGITAIPTIWVALTARITGQDRWINRRSLAVLAAVGAAVLLVVWTNKYHGLFRPTNVLVNDYGYPLLQSAYGIGFWVFAVYMYALLALGAVTLVRAIRQAPRIYRGQVIALITGAAAPWVGNLLFITGLNPFPGIDLTPIGFSVTGLAFGWALTRYQLLDIIPVARESVFENMADGVLVLDPRSRLIQINPAAQKFCRLNPGEGLGLTPGELPPLAGGIIAPLAAVRAATAEVQVSVDGQGHVLDVRLTEIAVRGAEHPRLIVFRDVTSQKQIERELRNQKQLFENLVAIARASTEIPTLEATFKNILAISKDLTGAQLGSIFLLDSKGRVTDSFLARGQVAPEVRKPLLTQVMDTGLAGWAVKNNQTALVHDTRKDARWVEVPDHPHPICAALAVPISSGSQSLGVLTLEHNTPGHFTQEHATMLEAAANQMALALRNAQIYDQQARLNRRQVMLYKVLRSISGHLDPETVLQVALDSVAAEMHIPGIAILLPSQDRSELVIKAAVGKLLVARDWRIPIEKGVSGRVFRSGRSENIADVSKDPDFISGNPNLRSELSIPLLTGRTITGVMSLQSDVIGAFEEEDALLAESIADAVSLALNNALLYAQSQKRLGMQTILREAGEQILSSVDLKSAMQAIGGQMVRAADVTSVYLLTYDALRNISTIIGEYISPNASPREQAPETVFEYPQEDPALIERLTGGAVELVTILDEQINREQAEDMQNFGVQSILFVPCLQRGRLIGYAELWESRYIKKYTEDEIALLLAIAQQAALAIQRARLFEEIQQARRDAEAANKAKSEFITVVAHELKGPMTTIKGFAEMLSIGTLGEVTDSQQNLLNIIQRTVNRMTLLVTDLTDISRIESGNLSIRLKDLDPHSLLAETQLAAEHLFAEKEQSLSFEIEPDLPKIIADPDRLSQILFNLLTNANKYTPQGGSVSLKAHPHNNARQYVQFSIQDNGIGISMEDQAHVFEKFFRSRDELARDSTGTGLGLNITRHLVELHGGKIWLESRLRQGTTIHFTIPASRETA